MNRNPYQQAHAKNGVRVMEQQGTRLLLLGVYGMEMVECGGTLCKNARMGGVSHASILFAGEKMREGLDKAAPILDCTIEYQGMNSATVSANLEEKLQLVRCIRRFRPDIIITQDPAHSAEDLDPGRRPAMTLLLEAMALSGRDFVGDTTGLEPWGGFTVYFMTPEHPNCLVDISEVWQEKCAAMDALTYQLEFIGELMEGSRRKPQYAMLIPGFDELPDHLSIGTAAKRLQDQAYHLYYGSTGHDDVFLSEAFRRSNKFVLDNLIK